MVKKIPVAFEINFWNDKSAFSLNSCGTVLLMFSRTSFPMTDEILESAEDVWALLAPIIATSNQV